jgi:hypothetical protein
MRSRSNCPDTVHHGMLGTLQLKYMKVFDCAYVNDGCESAIICNCETDVMVVACKLYMNLHLLHFLTYTYELIKVTTVVMKKPLFIGSVPCVVHAV